MFRLIRWGIFIALLYAIPSFIAQDDPRPEFGDHPIAARIQVSVAETDGMVTIIGEPGAIFASAQLAVRNLNTNETEYVQAIVDGSFEVELVGMLDMPFWISPARQIPNELRDQPGSLPGGAGTIIYGNVPKTDNFSIAGTHAQGALRWSADGQINRLAFQPGERLSLSLSFRMAVPDEIPDLSGLEMIGQFGLQPIIGADGRQVSTAQDAHNGWSSVLTASGLPIENIQRTWTIGETQTTRILRRDGQLTFRLSFILNIPDDLPPGMYAPTFAGYLRFGDGERIHWNDALFFSTEGEDGSHFSVTRLPLMLTIGEIEPPRLFWTLLMDEPSEGQRGIIADEDRSYAGLSGRVRFDSPNYILPPGEYPLEPYLPGLLANASDHTMPPLIALALPGGELSVEITLPDGSVQQLARSPFAQNRLSTDALDEATLFGSYAPVDVLRLTTLDPQVGNFVFDQYGEHTIQLSGFVEDVWGNRYAGGGTYRLLIAEGLDMTPGVLSGTPFEVGDVWNPVVHLTPGVPADIKINLRIYPLNGGGMIEHQIEGQANRYGYFGDSTLYSFDVPGEYVIDYEARYTDDEERLLADSLRTAGVIANPESSIIVHGRRGIDNVFRQRQAWFDTAIYPSDAPEASARPNYPYYSGDVAWIPDHADSGIHPVLQVQDIGGEYSDWLRNIYPDYENPLGNLVTLIREDALPLNYADEHPAYAIISAVRPDITLRHLVQGAADGDVPATWDGEDLFNEQIGSGASGNQPGDFVFLFGGAVVRNPNVGLLDSDIYASLAIIIDEDESTRVAPPLQGSALLTVNDEAVETFFHPTGVRPGQVFEIGESLVLAGQVAPTVPASIRVRITSPSGEPQEFTGQTNKIGYFYDPTQDVTLNEVGIWTIQIVVEHPENGVIGSVLGTENQRFAVYVVEPDSPLLERQQTADSVRSVQPGSVLNFALTVPEGWTETQGYHTISTPSYLLSSGDAPIFGQTTLSFQFDPTIFQKVFPNLNDGRGEGASASDVITITLAVTGTNESGQTDMRVRTFTLLYDTLISDL